MKFLTALFIAFFFVACDAGSAEEPSDYRAIYSSSNPDFHLVVELSSQGDVRSESERQGLSMWSLRTGGVDYFIIPQQDGEKVIEGRIAAELMREVMPAEFIERMNSEDMPRMEFESAGRVTVNGRTGNGYRMPGMPEDRIPFVFSDDPELAPLREAMAAQFEASIRLMPMRSGPFDQILGLLAEGAPLRFANGDLESFERVEIDDARFQLPAEPLDKDAARELMVEQGMIPAEPIEFPELPDASE